MSNAETGRLVLWIDDPALTTMTEFHSPRLAEQPTEKDPSFGKDEWEKGVLRAHIRVTSPDGGRRILDGIRQLWQEGQQAWARQYLLGQDTVDVRIVGITVVHDGSGGVVFRVYTPPEGVNFDSE